MDVVISKVESVADAAAALFAEAARESVRERGRFLVVLSGGSTPLALFERLRAMQDLPWEHTYLLWGDERFVPYSHPDSNFGAARAALLEHVPVRETHVHPWPIVPEDAHGSAAAYEEILRFTLGDEYVFDLTFLGLGADAHTASLFPNTGATLVPGKVVVTEPEDAPHVRLSLTPEALNRSRTVAFLVSGDAKRDAVRETLAGDGDTDRYPARAIRALERLVWLTDFPLE